jgi:hypothetical protein
MDKDCRATRFARSISIIAASLFAAGMGCATSEQHISSTGGTTGSAGNGSAGTSGAAGTSGDAGTTGNGGSTTGTAGTTGVAGTTGSAGSGGSGTAGTTGSGGTAGAAGASGTAGTGGSSAGTSGNAGRGGSGFGRGGSGGTTGSGGAAGSGTAGSSGTAGGTGTGCAAAQICEDFESGSISSSTWKVSMSGSFTATVGTDQSHSGTHSLHIVAPNTSNSAFITETKTFPASDFWGRAWLRFNGPNGGHQMYIYVALSGDQLRLLNRLGSDAIQVNFQKTDQFYASKTTVPQTTWFCYEWHVTTSATTIYKDGVQLTDIKAPGITGGTSLSLGFQRFATASAAADLWIDDVAVNTSQIGCN